MSADIVERLAQVGDWIGPKEWHQDSRAAEAAVEIMSLRSRLAEAEREEESDDAEWRESLGKEAARAEHWKAEAERLRASEAAYITSSAQAEAAPAPTVSGGPVAWVPKQSLDDLHKDGLHIAVRTAIHRVPLKSNGVPLYTHPSPTRAEEEAAVQDQIIGQIEDRFPNWRSYRDLIDCIDCTLASLRALAGEKP